MTKFTPELGGRYFDTVSMTNVTVIEIGMFPVDDEDVTFYLVETEGGQYSTQHWVNDFELIRIERE